VVVDAEDLVALYLNAHQAAGRSAQTIRWHHHSLMPFVTWLREEGHPTNPNAWTATLIREWIVYCQTRPAKRGTGTISASAVNSLIRSLKAFCHWLAEEELVERDPFRRVKVPKAPRLVKPSLSREEMAKVLAVARSGRNGYRDEAVLLFILDTGARASEVCSLRADAIDWRIGIAKLFGKGQKERYVPFSAHTAKAMQRYLARGRTGQVPEFFQSEEGQALTKSGLYQICKRLSLEAEVHVAPHKLRHTFAITYLRAGGNAFTLQKLLGHTTLHTTLTYVAMTSDDLVAEHHDHSPVQAMVKKRGR
jgi:site-specific recombinase XerD